MILEGWKDVFEFQCFNLHYIIQCAFVGYCVMDCQCMEMNTIEYQNTVSSDCVADSLARRRIWPPHVTDMNPCDFCLLGTLKNRIYSNNPHAEDDMQESIQYILQFTRTSKCN
jgi:hypothetical protein